MIKTCTLVPIHPPKFLLGLELIKSFNKFSKNDLFFAFSSDKDYYDFKSITNKFNLKFNHLIITRPSTFSVINFKKLFGTHILFGNQYNYDYVGILDSESEIVKKFNSDVDYSIFFEQQTIKANKTYKGDFITKHNTEVLKLQNSQKILESTENLSLYWWFNDICVYEKKSFIEFSKYYNSHPNLTTLQTSHWCFDWFIYSLWLVEFCEWKIIKPAGDEFFNWGALEHNIRNDVSLAFNSIVDSNPNHKQIEHIKIRIQKDRIK